MIETANQNRRGALVAGLAITLAVLLVYFNALEVPLLFDDENTIRKHGSLADEFLTLERLRYRHLFYGSFSANYVLGGFQPLGYHLFNTAAHVGTSILVFWIAFLTLSRGTGQGSKAARRIAVVAALFFALHPVHTESISYLSGRATSLAAFFYCLSLFMFIMGSLKETPLKLPPWLAYPASLFFYGCAVLSKETAVGLIVVAVLYDFFFMRGENWASLKRRILCFYLWFPVLALFVIVKVPDLTNLAKLWLAKIDPLYALLQIKYSFYPALIYFLPVNLTFDYDFPTVLNLFQPHFILAASGFLLLLFLILKKFYIQSPILSFCALWCLINLAPTNSFLPRADAFSERNLYLASVGLAIFFAVAAYSIIESQKIRRTHLASFGYCLVILVLILNSALLIHRNRVYQQPTVLWEDSYAKAPGKARILQNLARAYILKDDYDKAFVVLQELKTRAPALYFARLNLGKIYVHFGKPELALAEFLAAVKSNPAGPEGHFNLASYYATAGQLIKAAQEYDNVDSAELNETDRLALLLSRGKLQYDMKDYAASEKLLRKFLALDGAEELKPEAFLFLGKTYQATGRREKALIAFGKVAGTRPLTAQAKNQMAILHAEAGDNDQALTLFEKAVALDPALVEAHFNLGRFLLETGGDKILARLSLNSALEQVRDPAKVKIIRDILAAEFD